MCVVCVCVGGVFLLLLLLLLLWVYVGRVCGYESVCVLSLIHI